MGDVSISAAGCDRGYLSGYHLALDWGRAGVIWEAGIEGRKRKMIRGVKKISPSPPQHMRQESQGSLSTMKTSAAMGMSAQELNRRICFNWSPLCEGWGVVEREISTKG